MMALHMLVAAVLVSGTSDGLAQPARVGVAVLDFIDADGSGETARARALTALGVAALGKSDALMVMTQEDIRSLVSFDQIKTALSCESDSSCLADIGSALGVPFLLSGQLAALGPTLILSISLIDVEHAQPVGREVVSAPSEDQLGAGIEPAIARLIAPVLAGRVGALVVIVDQKGAVIEIDGRAVGTTPLPPLSLPVGSHRVTVSKKFFYSETRDVVVRVGQATSTTVTLKQLPDAEVDGSRPALFEAWRWGCTSCGILMAVPAIGADIYLNAPGVADPYTGTVYAPPFLGHSIGAEDAVVLGVYTLAATTVGVGWLLNPFGREDLERQEDQ